MSWKAWADYGYGYQLFNGNNFRQVIEFIAKYHFKPDVLGCEDEYDVQCMMDDACCADLVASTINFITGFNAFRGYDSCSDTNQEQYVGVSPQYAWLATEKDKTLTKEKAKEILERFAKELGITAEPDYFAAYYCG